MDRKENWEKILGKFGEPKTEGFYLMRSCFGKKIMSAIRIYKHNFPAVFLMKLADFTKEIYQRKTLRGVCA
jgi:hypothetical protein